MQSHGMFYRTLTEGAGAIVTLNITVLIPSNSEVSHVSTVKPVKRHHDVIITAVCRIKRLKPGR